MPLNFSNFTENTTSIADTQYLVGYLHTSSGGERRTTISNLRNTILSGVGIVPTGAIMYYASTSAPSGWLECNGAVITTPMGSSYTALRNFLIAAGYPFGCNGASPCGGGSDPKIPDLRGKFIRSNGSDGTHSSGTFGQIQADAFQGHAHGTPVPKASLGTAGGSNINGVWTNISSTSTTIVTDGTNGTPRTASETRPVNVALLACIKL